MLLSGNFPVVREFDMKNARGANKDSPIQEIVDGSIFGGRLSFAPSANEGDSMNFVGKLMPCITNKL